MEKSDLIGTNQNLKRYQPVVALFSLRISWWFFKIQNTKPISGDWTIQAWNKSPNEECILLHDYSLRQRQDSCGFKTNSAANAAEITICFKIKTWEVIPNYTLFIDANFHYNSQVLVTQEIISNNYNKNLKLQPIIAIQWVSILNTMPTPPPQLLRP